MRKHPSLVLFGQRLRELRKQRGWSQEILAEKAGVHPTYVGNVEQGRSNLTLLNILKFTVALEVDPADLLRGPSSTGAVNLLCESEDNKRNRPSAEKLWAVLTKIDHPVDLALVAELVEVVARHCKYF